MYLALMEKDHESKQNMDLVFTDQLLKKPNTTKTTLTIHISYNVCSESDR